MIADDSIIDRLHERMTKYSTPRVRGVMSLVYEAERPERSREGLRQIRKACRALGFTREEMLDIEYLFDYRREDGRLVDRFR